MKTTFRLSPHSITPNENVVELWYDGEFIGQLTGLDGPGVRVLSKHGISGPRDGFGPAVAGTSNVFEVKIAPLSRGRR